MHFLSVTAVHQKNFILHRAASVVISLRRCRTRAPSSQASRAAAMLTANPPSGHAHRELTLQLHSYDCLRRTIPSRSLLCSKVIELTRNVVTGQPVTEPCQFLQCSSDPRNTLVTSSPPFAQLPSGPVSDTGHRPPPLTRQSQRSPCTNIASCG